MIPQSKEPIYDFWDNYQKVRAVLDCAGSSNFITRECLNKLGLSSDAITMDICGIRQLKTGATLSTT